MAGQVYSGWLLYRGVNQSVFVNNTNAGAVISVSICNMNPYSTQISIAISTDAINPGTADWIDSETTVNGYQTYERGKLVISPGSYIVVRSTQDNVNAKCYGTSYGDDIGSVSLSINSYPNGSTLARAAPSAKYIKAATGTNTDGVYWIKASSSATAQQVYCIMDNTWDGGGWMIVANNNALTVLGTASFQPRLTSNPTYVGTTGANSYTYSNTFSINVLDMPIKELAWCAFSSNDWKNIFTYSYGRFVNYPRFIPTSMVYIKRFDQYHLTLPWKSATDVRVRPNYLTTPTDDTNSFSAIGLHDGNAGYGAFGVYAPSVMVLGRNAANGTYPISENDTNCIGMGGIFSWSDTASAGWDDYQNGNSLGDAWGIDGTANYGRGLPSYIMIR